MCMYLSTAAQFFVSDTRRRSCPLFFTFLESQNTLSPRRPQFRECRWKLHIVRVYDLKDTLGTMFSLTKCRRVVVDDEFLADLRLMLLDLVQMEMRHEFRLVCKEWRSDFYRRVKSLFLCKYSMLSIPVGRGRSCGIWRDYGYYVPISKNKFSLIQKDPSLLQHWPKPEVVHPLSIVVVKCFACTHGSNVDAFSWFLRFTFDDEDMDKFKSVLLFRLPMKWVEEFIRIIWRCAAMRQSTLVTMYRPECENIFPAASEFPCLCK